MNTALAYVRFMQKHLSHLEKSHEVNGEETGTFLRIEPLTMTPNNHIVPLVTISSSTDGVRPLKQREIVVLTSRVHPGETNSSWIMEGVLSWLVTSRSSKAKELRSKFVFKIIPMLNVEGVINGWLVKDCLIFLS